MAAIAIQNQEMPYPRIIPVEEGADAAATRETARLLLLGFYVDDSAHKLFRVDGPNAGGDYILRKLRVKPGSIVEEMQATDADFELDN